MKSRNSWLSLSIDAMNMTMEAQSVIALRLARAAVGGAAAEKEAALMVSEKIDTGLELQRQLLMSGFGLLNPSASSKAVAHVRRKIRANRRRLLRGG